MKTRLLPLLGILCTLASAARLSADENDPHWTWAGWGGGGWFRCVAFDPVDPNTLYMGGDVIGVYKSTDGAESWSFVNRGLQNYAVFGIAAAKSAPGTLYALTVDGAARSTDGGAHWTPIKKTRRNALNLSAIRRISVQPIVVDPRDADTVWIGSGKGVLARSADGGRTWTEIHYLAGVQTDPGAKVSPAITSVLLPEGAPGRVIVTTYARGIFRSEDGGASWSHPKTPASAMHVAGGFERAPDLYYGAFGKEGVYVSGDGGATWAKTEGALPPNADARMVAVDPRNPHVAHLIVRSGHFITYDLGATWNPCRHYVRDFRNNPTLPDEPPGRRKSGVVAEPNGIALSPADPDRIFIAANWNNVVSSDCGVSWRESARGADISCVHDLRFLGGSVYAAAMDEGLLRSDDNGETWTAVTPKRWLAGLSGHQWRVLPQQKPDGGVRIVSTLAAWKDREVYPNAVLVSEDGGQTFLKTTAGLPDYRPTVNTMWEEGYARALAADPSDPATLYLGIDGDAEPDRCGGGVFKSTDGGRTWAQLSHQPASRRVFYGLAVDPTDAQRLYWGACGEGSGVYVSGDGGETWGKTSVSEWVYNVETAPSGMVLAGGKNLWISRDHGETWKQATKFTGGVTVCGIAVDPEVERRIWVSAVRWGTNVGNGVWESLDGGETWADITGDLPNTRPGVLRYNPATHELWAAGPAIFRVKR